MMLPPRANIPQVESYLSFAQKTTILAKPDQQDKPLAAQIVRAIMARFCESEVMPLLNDCFPRFRSVCISCIFVLLFLQISIAVQAQDASGKSETSAANSTKPAKGQPALPKLTPEQKQALHLLDEAQAGAPALQPGMQAFVLFEVANTYQKFNKTKSRDLFQQAFLASLSMDDETRNCGISPACGVKGWVQMEILNAIARDSPEEAEKLMVRAETPARNNMTAELVRKYVEAKNYGHAQDLLTQIADQPNYPYPVATTLILSFPKDQSAECQRVFGQAFANFNQYGTSGIIGTQDFGALILQTANRLPPQLVLEAIDKMLDEAKSNEFMKNVHMTLGSKSNDVSLNSLYELRLFQLLPVLQQVDPSRAESLLRDDAQMRNILTSNPAGMGAFEPGRGGKGEAILGQSISLSGDAGSSQFQAQREAAAQMMRREGEIESEASQAPQQAIAEALSLPVAGFGPASSPRAEALKAIAANLIKQNPAAAKSALNELMKFADQLKDNQAQFLVRVPELYLEIGDKDDAASAVKVLAKKAEAAYAKDNDADDPNQAFKGAWPSTNLWQQCMKSAAKISPQLVQDIIAGIPDSDIAAFVKIGYAKALLGINFQYSVAVQHKNGQNFFADYNK